MLRAKRRILSIAVLSLLAVSQTLYCIASSDRAMPNIPEDSTKVLPFATEQSVSTFVPSSSAPGNGLAVNIIYPKITRYKQGAPIAVVVAGGDAPNGLNLTVHGAQVGIVEIRFSFPGGGVGNFKSGGYNDYRGAKSQKALHDILLFAAGRGEDFKHRTIADLLPIKLCPNNIGIVGWSNGGNAALLTMEKYSTDLSFVRWLTLYECPLGSLFFPPSLGSTHDFLPNSHYRQGSAATGRCLIDFRRLAWQADAHQNPGIHKKLGEPDLPGVIYFDDNKNGRWDETVEYAFNYCLDKGLRKKIYPPDITSAMERLKIFDPPETMATKGANGTVPGSNVNPATNSVSSPAATSGAPAVSNAKANATTKTNASTSANLVSSVISTRANNTTATLKSATAAKPPVDRIDQVVNAFYAAGRLKTKIERKKFNLNPFKDKSPPLVIPKRSGSSEALEEKDQEKEKANPNWPGTIATLEESEAYFQERDGSVSIPAICSSFPNLLVTIVASQVDHLQSQPDHPHIVLQYNAWLDNGAHWVRLNPETVYLANLANMNKSNFVQNEANSPIDATNINEYLEPAGALKDYVYTDAAIAELADRCQFKKYNGPLTEPIYLYDNGAVLPVTKKEETSSAATKAK